MLKQYQIELQVGHLYRLITTNTPGKPQLKPNIFVKGGSIDVHNSNSADQPTAISEMEAVDDDIDVRGTAEVYIVPEYIAITQNTGTSTEIVLSQCQAIDLGEIS